MYMYNISLKIYENYKVASLLKSCLKAQSLSPYYFRPFLGAKQKIETINSES